MSPQILLSPKHTLSSQSSSKKVVSSICRFLDKKPFVWVITVYVHGVMSCDVEVWCHGLEYAANSCSSFFPINFDRWLNPIFRRDSVGKLFVFEILFYFHLAMKRAHEKLPAGTPWKELRLYTSSEKLRTRDGDLQRSPLI